MDLFAVPEIAIRTFEQIHGLRVTVHDLCGTLEPFLDADRFHHSHPICQAVKSSAGDGACLNFEMSRLRDQLPTMPEGRVHVCHAGLVEWVVPVFKDRALALVLFAGARRAGSALLPDYREELGPASARVSHTGLPPVSQQEAMRILEHLRQLAARLGDCLNKFDQTENRPGHPEHQPDDRTQRRTLIHRFVQERCLTPVRLRDLADALHLSEDRAGHVVREASGKTFVQLLTDARLRVASSLLRHTDLSITSIALRSGFAEVAHFHRTFRKYLGATPAKYRKAAST